MNRITKRELTKVLRDCSFVTNKKDPQGLFADVKNPDYYLENSKLLIMEAENIKFTNPKEHKQKLKVAIAGLAMAIFYKEKRDG